MKGKHAKNKEWNRTVRRMLSIIPVLLVALSVYTMSALAWFRSSIMEKPMEIASGQYVGQVEIVKDATGLMNDENLIGRPYQTSSFLNESVDLSGLGGAQKAYIIVSNFKENETKPGTIADPSDNSSRADNIPFQYELELKIGNENATIERVTSSEGTQAQNNSLDVAKCQSLEPGKKDVYAVTLPGSQNADLSNVKLQLRTAFTGSTIHTAYSLEDLQKDYAPGSVVYLMNNIEEPERELRFEDGSYPNLVLNGYLLEVKSLTVDAGQDVYSTMDIGGGMLKIDGKTYSDEDTIQSEGEGNVTVKLLDLKDTYQQNQIDAGETNDAEVLDQPESQNNEVEQPVSPQKGTSGSISSTPSRGQGSDASKPAQKPPVSSSSAASSSSVSSQAPSSVSSPPQGISSSKPAGGNTVSTPPAEPDRSGQQNTAMVDKAGKD